MRQDGSAEFISASLMFPFFHFNKNPRQSLILHSARCLVPAKICANRASFIRAAQDKIQKSEFFY